MPDGRTQVTQPSSLCDHVRIERTALYEDGRKVWRCLACGALLVDESIAPEPEMKLVPLRISDE